MTKIVAFVLQLAVAVLLTAAGLYFDYASLAVFGVALFGLAVVLGLWLVIAGKPTAPPPRANAASDMEPNPRPPQNMDEKERALWAMRRALEDAKLAAHYFSGMNRMAVLNRLLASYGPVATHFDLPAFNVSAISARSFLRAVIGYVESFLPLLEDGQVAAARNAAQTYIRWSSD